jgi:hypothetical protein
MGKKPYLGMQFLTHFLPFFWGRLLATTTTVTVSMSAVAVTVSSMAMTMTSMAMTVTGMIVGVTVTSMMIMGMTMTGVRMTVTHNSFDVLLHDLVLRHVGLLGPLEGGRLVMAVTMVVMRMIVSMHQLARQQHSQK